MPALEKGSISTTYYAAGNLNMTNCGNQTGIQGINKWIHNYGINVLRSLHMPFVLGFVFSVDWYHFEFVGWGVGVPYNTVALHSTLILISLEGVKGAQVEEIYDLSKPFRGWAIPRNELW